MDEIVFFLCYLLLDFCIIMYLYIKCMMFRAFGLKFLVLLLPFFFSFFLFYYLARILATLLDVSRDWRGTNVRSFVLCRSIHETDHCAISGTQGTGRCVRCWERKEEGESTSVRNSEDVEEGPWRLIVMRDSIIEESRKKSGRGWGRK